MMTASDILVLTQKVRLKFMRKKLILIRENGQIVGLVG